MSLSNELAEVVARHSLLKHPFYQAWSEGSLSRQTLAMYAAEYYAQVRAFPRFVSSVHSRCPNIEARKVLLENLVDEEIRGVDHPELWMRFAEGLGVSRDEVRGRAMLPETQASVDAFYTLTAGHWTDGLCALFAYESQVPEVSESKIAGLKKFYGVDDSRTLSFFTAHMKYDVEHSRQVATLIDQHADRESALRTTEQAAEALWSFLDGVAKQSGVSCQNDRAPVAH
jgi:pyrroloquinoline-quinone synthase